MSLRAFHLFFIALSAVLAVFFAAWASGQYRLEGGGGYVMVMVAALAAAGVLASYAVAFRRKTRGLS
jgi:hypothetical protein